MKNEALLAKGMQIGDDVAADRRTGGKMKNRFSTPGGVEKQSATRARQGSINVDYDAGNGNAAAATTMAMVWMDDKGGRIAVSGHAFDAFHVPARIIINGSA